MAEREREFVVRWFGSAIFVILFLHARGLGVALAMSVLSAVLSAVLTVVQVPVLGAPDFLIPAPLLLTLVPVFAVARLLDPPTVELERVATRRARLFHVSTVLGFTLITVIFFHAALALSGLGLLAPAADRNVVGFMAMSIVAAALFGSQWAWLLPTSLLLAAAVGGVDHLREVRVWAWPISASVADSSIGAAIVCVLVAVGLSLWRGTTSAPLLRHLD